MIDLKNFINRVSRIISKNIISQKLGIISIGLIVIATMIAFYLNNSSNQDNKIVFYEANSSTTTTNDTIVTVTPTDKTTSIVKSKTAKAKSTSKSISSIKTITSKQIYEFPADINTITIEHLMEIDGIGSITAEKIISFRNEHGLITNLDLLLQVNGIGEITLQKLKENLYVSDQDYIPITQSQTTITTQYLQTTTTENKNTSIPKTTTTKITTVQREMSAVNINTATAEQISDCLLLDLDVAEEIVELRTNFHGFNNYLELLYINDITNEMLEERRQYIKLK